VLEEKRNLEIERRLDKGDIPATEADFG